MNWTFFKALLELDSTTGRERETALWLLSQLDAPSKQSFEVGDGTLNLLLSWGTPRVVFCTHMDTVPPYIAPGFLEDIVVTGRGSCDAKGQIFAMYTACKELEAAGCTDFGLLLLAGEETGSWGAKAFAKTDFKAPYLIVGEPTENKLVSASKGTLSYDLTFTGEAFHSGYPQFGVSAVDLFNQFYNALKAVDWGQDPVLGETTWNVGLLHSDNPQNILSPSLTCRLYFRTTFVSHEAVQRWMSESGREVFPSASLRDSVRASAPGNTSLPDAVPTGLTVTARGGDVPARYLVPEGFDGAPVAFGSDAPHLSNFRHKLICGPGSIRYAHRPDEHVLAADLEAAVALYQRLFHTL
ncbi:MAG: M20/M25/M40 family metallo-hydrolase [Bacteroidales bacterium]|nr:M20/M25/M40 family metallo-hydrolase [Bacteroidales bacterium]